MRSVCRVALAFSLMVLVATQTSAQQDKDKKKGFGRGGFNSAAGLVLNASVQKELKLSDEQIEKAKKVSEEVLAKFADDLKKLREATPEERAEIGHKISEETYKAMGDLLKADQVKRLKQIELQQRGLADPGTQKALKLSDEQKEKIKKIGEDTREKAREVFKDAQGDFKAAAEKMATLTKEAREKQANLLTDDQKKQWKEMTGEPFEVKFEPRPRNKTN